MGVARVAGRLLRMRAGATAGAIVLGLLLSDSSLRASPGPIAWPPPPVAPGRGSLATVASPDTDLARPTTGRPQPSRKPAERRGSPKNEIITLEAESLSGQAMQVTVDYAYAGDQGTEDVFLHAAALQHYSPVEGLRNRVPGTGFPGEAVEVGNGRVTLTIARVVDGDASTSTSVRVCLISIPKHSAFLCRNFAHTKEWD
jgi:hypothetical protein